MIWPGDNIRHSHNQKRSATFIPLPIGLSRICWHNFEHIIVGSEHKHNMSTIGLIALENELVCCCQGHCLNLSGHQRLYKTELFSSNGLKKPAFKHNRIVLQRLVRYIMQIKKFTVMSILSIIADFYKHNMKDMQAVPNAQLKNF